MILVVKREEPSVGTCSRIEYRLHDSFGTQVGQGLLDYFGPDMVLAVARVGYCSGRLVQVAVPSVDPVNRFECLYPASRAQVLIVQRVADPGRRSDPSLAGVSRFAWSEGVWWWRVSTTWAVWGAGGGVR